MVLSLGRFTLYFGQRRDLPAETRLVKSDGFAEVRAGHAHAGLCWT